LVVWNFQTTKPPKNNFGLDGECKKSVVWPDRLSRVRPIQVTMTEDTS
jgi:hypothetical protein